MAPEQSSAGPDPLDYTAFPPNDWAPRGQPTADDIEAAFDTAHNWHRYAVGPRGDGSLATFLDTFHRHLAGEVERREKQTGSDRTVQATLIPE